MHWYKLLIYIRQIPKRQDQIKKKDLQLLSSSMYHIKYL